MSQITRFSSGGGGGGSLNTLTGDTGGAVSPTGGNIDILGGDNIVVDGNPGTSTLEVSVTGTTNHAVQVGNGTGSLTSLAAATNGQLIIGSTGVDPVVATLTAGAGISITNGAGSITVATVADGFVIATVQTVGAVNGDLFTLTLAGNRAANIFANVVGTPSDYSASLVGTANGGARRAGGGAVLIGSPLVDFSEDSANAPNLDIVVSGNDVIVRVTGVAAQTWNWRGLIQYVLQTV
jgi:hypothetical protein